MFQNFRFFGQCLSTFFQYFANSGVVHPRVATTFRSVLPFPYNHSNNNRAGDKRARRIFLLGPRSPISLEPVLLRSALLWSEVRRKHVVVAGPVVRHKQAAQLCGLMELMRGSQSQLLIHLSIFCINPTS